MMPGRPSAPLTADDLTGDRAAARAARATRGQGVVPFIPWDQFQSGFRWKQGQHVTLLGPTQQGKTTLALKLLEQRRFVVIFAAKPRDPTLERLLSRGFVRIERWPRRLVLDPDKPCRILFWPKIPTLRALPAVRGRYEDALDAIMRQGGWTVDIDEGVYASTFLGLRNQLSDMWQRAATQAISLMFLAQRSANVPPLAYDQIDHLFAARENDRRNAERIGEMAGQDRLMVREVVGGLPRHHFLYLGVRDDILAITKAPKPGGKK